MRDAKKQIVEAMIGLMILLLLIGIASWSVRVSNKETVLTLGIFTGSNWDTTDGTLYQIIDETIARFEKEHTGVRVEYEGGVSEEDYSEWLAGKILLGEEPDVFMVLSDDFNTLAADGALMNLDSVTKKDPSFHKKNYYAAAYAGGEYNKSSYALPFECIPTLMFVNKTLLQQEGIEMPDYNWTWGDFHQICKEVTKSTDKDKQTEQFGSYNYTWKDAAYSNGAILFNEQGTKSYVNNDRMENAVNFVYELNDINNGYQVTATDFESGNVAFCPMLFYDYKNYKSYPWNTQKYTDFEWGCTTMPAGPKGDNYSELDTLLLGVDERTTEKELSWELLKAFSYDERTQSEIFQYSQGVSPLKQMTESQQVGVDNSLLSTVMDKSMVAPKFRAYAEGISMMDIGIKDALKSDNNIHTSLILLQKKIDNYLNDR